MRRFLAGVFLLLTIPAVSLAQFKGEVERIGFGDGYFRPNCFCPMLIRVQAQTSGTYQIQVVQEDLDRDLQIFAQTVSLTGAEDGKGAEQRFWMYFIPQPSDGGLIDTTRGGSLRELQQQLKVFLCDEKGNKQLAQLTVTSTIQNIDSVAAGPFNVARGRRLILAVSDGAAQPIWRDYQNAIGTMEDVIFVAVRSSDLPEDVRGFEMIDGIIWLAAPLPDPRRPSDEKRYKAIQDYVRGGGHLVICQPAQRDATASVAEMLPVNVLSIEPRNDLEPLRTIATERLKAIEEERTRTDRSDNNRPGRFRLNPEQGGIAADDQKAKPDSWRLPTGPFMFARAEPKRGAIVYEKKLKWKPDGSDETPYIARHAYGLGCVTWVAHDLSDPVITNRAKTGWPYVWDAVLDYKSDLTIIDNDTSEDEKARYGQTLGGVDLSNLLVEKMQLTAKSRALISIAVVFFIAYWAIAGPGVYFYLLTRTRPQLSWFMFALSAVVATALTVAVVKLVVRGAPEMAHITVVRGAAGMPQISISRFGLYIPRDGEQELALTEVAPRQISYLIADARHPKQAPSDVEFPAQERYLVPIHDTSEEGPVKIKVPFRSTAKEFEARRVGQVGAIEGAGKLRETEGGNVLEGTVTNGTGNRLVNVYLVYHDPSRPGGAEDICYFLPSLEKSQSVDLRDLSLKLKKVRTDDRDESNLTAYPSDNVRLYGVVGSGKFWSTNSSVWAKYWYGAARTDQVGETRYADLERAFPMMSLFQRLPPVFNGWKGNNIGRNSRPEMDRFELLRRGGRYLDCSNVVAAGQILVIAQADDDKGRQPPALPFPLEVWGDKVEGKGVVYYQFGIPLERIPAPPAPASTQPSTTKPATSVKLGTQPAVTAKVES